MTTPSALPDPKDGREAFHSLPQFAAMHRRELEHQLQPYLKSTAAYGELLSRVTWVLGHAPPHGTQDRVVRDLMPDAFDFLIDAERCLLEGNSHVAYPLLRRAFEDTCLLVSCIHDAKLAERWEAGAQIGNAELRKTLAASDVPENEQSLREAYQFFSKGTHPNRALVAGRFLGEGNVFVLGAIGQPELLLVVDACHKALQVWFWLVAAVGFQYRGLLEVADKTYPQDYLHVATESRKAATWLVEQFNRLLREHQAGGRS